MHSVNWREVPAGEAEWITAATQPFDPTAPWQGFRVAQVAPAGFAAYVKVLDFAWEDTVIPDLRGSRERWRMHLLAYDTLLPGLAPGREQERPFPVDSPRLRRSRWAELAAKFGFPVHPGFGPASFQGRAEDGGWPARIIQPRDGTLCEPAFRELLAVLAPRARELCFHWEAGRMLRGGHTAAHTLRGPAGTWPQNWPRRVDLMPGLIWPPDRTWVVAMNLELDFAIVACGPDVAAALLAHPQLECLTVAPHHRVDAEAANAP